MRPRWICAALALFGGIAVACSSVTPLRAPASTPSGDGGADAPGDLVVDNPSPTAVVQIAAGFADTCAVRRDGHVLCWGANAFGLLGDGRTHETCRPNRVDPEQTYWIGDVDCSGRPVIVTGLDDATQVAIGDAPDLTGSPSFVCVVRRDGHVACWGDDEFGQIGNGTITDAQHPVTTPSTIVGLDHVVEVSAGDVFACARRSDGQILCWGDPPRGRSGSVQPVPVAIPVHDAIALAAASGQACAVRTDETVVCWGYIDTSAFPAYGIQPSPVTIPGIRTTASIVASPWQSYALRTDGRVVTWFGDGLHPDLSLVGYVNTSPDPLALPTDARAITASRASGMYWWFGFPGQRRVHACALRRNGTVVCWGSDLTGELGDARAARGGCDPLNCSAVPVPVVGLADVVQVSAGTAHTCALRRDGRVFCWGSERFGRLGNGVTLTTEPCYASDASGYEAHCLVDIPTPVMGL